MNRLEKESGSAHPNFHCFPSIEKTLEKATESASGSCNAFQPLYQSPNGESSAGSCDSGNHKDSSHNALEEVRERSFLKGIEAGKSDACNIGRQELQGPVSQFLNENDKLEHCYTKITDRYAIHIPELALAIAKKILGDHLALDEERLDPICKRLHALLAQHYQMSLKFNSEEIISLSRILECARPQWKQSASLNIMDDVEIQKGQIRLVNPEESNDLLINKLKQDVEDMITDA